MSSANVTLKKIAERAGVSITTVHRALNNKEGCSDQLKEKILSIAKEEGFSSNYVAASLRKRTLYVALIFPGRVETSKYYLQKILDGYLDYRATAGKFNMVFQEYYVNSLNGTDIHECLRNICNDLPIHYDGVVVYGLGWDEKTNAYLNRLIGKGTPVISLDKAIYDMDAICAVQPNDKVAGQMGAELMAKILHESGSVMVVQQPLVDGDKNGKAFIEELHKRRPDLTVCQTFPNLSDEIPIEEIQDSIARLPDIRGIYVTCARHTDAVIRLIRGGRLSVQCAIGSDFFEETYQALQDEVLDAVIDKRPYMIGYKALELLFSRIVKLEPLPAGLNIMPRVIIRANSTEYYKRRKITYGDESDSE